MKNRIDATRRQWLMAGQAFSTALVLGPRVGAAQSLRTLKFGVGLKAMSATVINAVIGEALGYHKLEGFTLAAQSLGTNANVQVATARGDVDIGIGVPSFGLPLLARGEWGDLLNFYQYTYPYKWDVVVTPGSAIKSYGDLKGKRIGVSGFGATEYPVTRNVLKAMGFDPDADVKWVAVGGGVPAGVALKGGTIDALAYFDTGFGQIEASGIALEFLPRPASVPLIGGQFLMARKSVIDADRKLVVGFGRSVAKASRFILANPAAGAKAFLGMYPETAPRGSSSEEAVKAVLQTISRRIKLYEPPYPGVKMGTIKGKEFETEAAMADLKIADYSRFFTNDLIAEINDFEVGAIEAQAKGYRG